MTRSGDGRPSPLSSMRVLNATSRVVLELRDPPITRVELTNGKVLRFTARQMTALSPRPLNEKWLRANPRDLLRATRDDFKQIRDYWLSIMEEEVQKGYRPKWEIVSEQICKAVASLPVHSDETGFLRGGAYLESGGPLWVSVPGVIQPVVDAARWDPMDPRYIRYLRRTGAIVAPSKVFLVKGWRIRAWAFAPDVIKETPK